MLAPHRRYPHVVQTWNMCARRHVPDGPLLCGHGAPGRRLAAQEPAARHAHEQHHPQHQRVPAIRVSGYVNVYVPALTDVSATGCLPVRSGSD